VVNFASWVLLLMASGLSEVALNVLRTITYSLHGLKELLVGHTKLFAPVVHLVRPLMLMRSRSWPPRFVLSLLMLFPIGWMGR
jgi:hypothetical protein